MISYQDREGLLLEDTVTRSESWAAHCLWRGSYQQRYRQGSADPKHILDSKHKMVFYCEESYYQVIGQKITDEIQNW